MINCLDLLASAKYPNEALKFKNYGIRGFATTFGDFYPVAEKLLKAGLDHLGVDLLWSDTHSFGDANIPEIKKLSAKYQTLAEKYPGRYIELSPFTEHNLSNPDKYMDIAATEAPNCTIVNNPWKGAFSKKYKNEIHGEHVKPQGKYNYSFDGTECTNADVEAAKAAFHDCERFYMWSARFNLKWGMNDSTPRPLRKAYPTKEYIDSIVYLFGDRGFVDLPKGWLVKSHAEKHDAADNKGDKLLIISPVQTKEITLKRNNKIIAVLPYYGAFDGGGHRYYWKNFGYKAGANLEVFIGSKKQGTINGGFRLGGFRK